MGNYLKIIVCWIIVDRW